MGTDPEMPTDSPKASLYERDYHAWLAEQARILRAGKLGSLDTKNLIEEIEDKRICEEAALESAIEQAFLHLTKLALSPSSNSVGRWQASTVKQRVEIEKILRRNPGLQSSMAALKQEAWVNARKLAIAEMAHQNKPLSIPDVCPFTFANVRDESYWPEDLIN